MDNPNILHVREFHNVTSLMAALMDMQSAAMSRGIYDAGLHTPFRSVALVEHVVNGRKIHTIQIGDSE